ncbi:response regulator transcription factor [Stenotrophomonas rhizophila]|nr:response regulator transcription factor [Stenotrophomonas rhizophila]MCC7664187.1 response regulator transcription factor [Stenotrophomonas rhizophila]
MGLALLDDHQVVLHGMSIKLRERDDMAVVGAWTGSRALLESLATRPVDVLLMDYCLTRDEIDGCQLIALLRTHHPQMRILVVSAHHSALIVDAALRAGAHGYVCKTVDWPVLIEAILRVAGNHRYLSQADQDWFGTDRQLSPRERDVLRHSLAGDSVSALAERQGLSEKTISTQKRSAYRKLGLHGDADLFRLAPLVYRVLGGEPESGSER